MRVGVQYSLKIMEEFIMPPSNGSKMCTGILTSRLLNTCATGPVPFYFKRSHILEKIDRCFEGSGRSQPLQKCVVLQGGVGTGKTQIALDYAQTASRTQSVFWVRADCWANVVDGYGHIAKALKPRESLPEDPALLLSRVKDLLEEQNARQWVLMLDDFWNDKHERLRMIVVCNLLPRSPNGRILICTRDISDGTSSFRNIMPGASFIQISGFSATEAAEAQACLSKYTQTSTDIAESDLCPNQLPLVVIHSALRKIRNESQFSEGPTNDLQDGKSDNQKTSQESRASVNTWIWGGLKQSLSQLTQFITPFKRETPVFRLESIEYTPAILLNLLSLFGRPRIPDYIVRPMYTELAIDIMVAMNFDEALTYLEELALVTLNDDRDEYEAPSLVRGCVCSQLDKASTIQYLNVIISGLSKSFPLPKSNGCQPDLRDAWDSQTYLLCLSSGVIETAQKLKISSEEFALLLFKAGTAMYHLRVADLAAEYLQQCLKIHDTLGTERLERLPVMRFRLLTAAASGDNGILVKIGKEYFEFRAASEIDPTSFPYLLVVVMGSLLGQEDKASVNRLLERTAEFVASSGLYSREQISKLPENIDSIRSVSNTQDSAQFLDLLWSVIDPSGHSPGIREQVRLFFEDDDTVDRTIDKILNTPKRGVYQDPYILLQSLLSYFNAMDSMNYSQTNRIRTVGSRLLERLPHYMTPQQIIINVALTDSVGLACIVEGDWADAEVYFVRELNALDQASRIGYEMLILQGERDQAVSNVALALCLQNKNQELQQFEQLHAESLARKAASRQGKDFKNDAMMFFVTDVVRKAEQRGESDTRAALLEALQSKLLEFNADVE